MLIPKDQRSSNRQQNNRQQQQQQQQQNTQQQDRWSRSKLRRSNGALQVLIGLTSFALVVATGLFIFLNIQPYIKVTEILASQSLNWSLVNFIMSLPLLGWVLFKIASIGATIVGIALWAIIQFFELLPTLLTRDIETLRSVIGKLEKVEQMAVKESDHPYLARLKGRFNDLPFEWIELASRVAMVVYTIDFGLCLMTYPPIKGGLENISLFLMAPSFGDIDWPNLLCAVVTLFAIEVIWRAWHWLRNISEHFRGRNQQATS